MERVQFQQEQMLAELKDLVEKGLFTQKEVKEIMQKRTAFETALVRRIPKKSDFLRYATYEMSLEALRRKRAKHLESDTAKAPPSISDYALVRRQFQIFERALKKFKGDVGLWLQYIQVAKKEGARALVGRITARALQLHPNVPALYVYAASHELEHLSPSAARTLLQRGIRLNAGSVEMWREYVRMELGFVESLRRRWDVLGIDVKGKGKDTGKSRETDADELWNGLGDGEGDPVRMDVDVEEDVDEDEAARKQIMEGAIVKSAISNAVKAIPKFELFASLHELISNYPSPPNLREQLLDHLHTLLHETLPSSPAAIKLSATRHLTPELSGELLVGALKSANERLSEAVKNVPGEGRHSMANTYAEFVEEWCGKDVDIALKAYLITSLHILIQQLPSPVPPALLAAHIRLLVAHHASLGSGLLPVKANTPDKILRAARKHTKKAPHSSIVWLARLGAEKQFEPEAVDHAWAEARKNVSDSDEGIESVWLWGLEPSNRPPPSSPGEDEDPTAADVQLLEHLLHESQLIEPGAAAGALHEVLLIRYAVASHRALLYHSQVTRDEGTIATTSAIDIDIDPDAARSHPPSASAIARAQRNGTTQDVMRSKTKTSRARTSPERATVDARLGRVRRIATAYAPSGRVWAEVFAQESSSSSATTTTSSAGGAASAGYFEADKRVLRAVYDLWRQTDGVGATVAWGTWLLRSGDGKGAVALVGRARAVLGETDGAEVERRWRAVLDGPPPPSNLEEGEGTGGFNFYEDATPAGGADE